MQLYTNGGSESPPAHYVQQPAETLRGRRPTGGAAARARRASEREPRFGGLIGVCKDGVEKTTAVATGFWGGTGAFGMGG